MSKSNYTLKELADAQLVPDMSGPNAYLVDFGNDTYDLVSKTAKHTLILKDGLDVRDTVSYGGIMVNFQLENDEIYLTDSNGEVRLPSEKHEHALWAVHDGDGDRLRELFEEYNVPTVRKGLMDMLMPRFRESKEQIRKTDDGWLLNDDILVSWDGTNHPVSSVQTHVVSGGATVQADEDKEAREIRLRHSYDDMPVTLPNGTETTLDEVEVRFLVTAGLVLGTGATGLYDDELSSAVEASTITAFTDTKSGLHHNHSMTKHTLDMLGVTDEAMERLWYNEYDHAGVHELYVRRSEFMDAPITVFEDAPNNSNEKWSYIKNTSKKAPIPTHVREDLESRYE